MPTFTTPEPIHASIEIDAGDIRLEASERGDTQVEVGPANPANPDDVKFAEVTEVVFAGGFLRVKTLTKQSRSLAHGGTVSVVVSLPAGSRVEASTLAGDVRGTGDLGTSSAFTHRGDIRLGTVSGALQAGTESGDIIVERALGDVSAKTTHGDIRIGEITSGTVGLESGAGELEVGIAEGAVVKAESRTSYGEVRDVRTNAAGQGPVAVKLFAFTGHGDIVIRPA